MMKILVFIIICAIIFSCPDEEFLYKEKCVLLCPEGTYGDSYQICKQCGDFCDTCKGPGDNECLTCIKGLYFYQGSCSASCNLGQFKNMENQQCTQCDPICNLCEERPNKCISCYFEKILTDKFECGDKCEDNQYVDRSTPVTKCQKCYKTCKTCSSGKAGDCLSCFLGYDLTQGKCNSKCTPSEYFDPFSQHCQQCHPNCKSCIGDWEDDCIECFKGKRLENGVCSDQCSNDKFYDGESCISCHNDCLQCFGKKANQCSQCPDGKYLTHQNECSDTCRDGTFVETGNWKCQMCFKNCIECFGPGENQCAKCYENMNFEEGRCLRLCPDKFYFDDGQCQKCHASCETCQQKGPLECTSCFDGFYLNEDQCVSICPFGFYQNEEQRICIACDDACEKCTGPSFRDCILENKIVQVEEFRVEEFRDEEFRDEEFRETQDDQNLNNKNNLGLESVIVKLKQKMEKDMTSDEEHIDDSEILQNNKNNLKQKKNKLRKQILKKNK